jgi:RNA polymerase sigma-70 factor, ECF subfamily
MQMLEEQNLIKECAEGDLKKFGALYDFYAEKIYRFVYFRVRHKETCQDLVSQTFFKALEGIRSFEATKGNFSSWLYRIARNNIIDHWRARKVHLDIDNLWDLRGDANLEEDAQIKEKIEKVKECLAKLEGFQREIIVMKIWDGLSHKEISQILGKSEGNIKMTFSRAMGKLRKEEILALLALCVLINQII